MKFIHIYLTNMNQIYLVIEDNGESYEDYHEWPVAAFDDENKAKNYVNKALEAHKLQQVIEKQEYVSYLGEENFLFAAIPWNPDITNEQNNIDNQEIELSIYEYLANKYPNARDNYYSHSFRVSKPIPFNPS